MARSAGRSYFGDFDVESVYQQEEKAVLQANDGMFVIEFDSTTASSTSDLNEASLDEILQSKPDKTTRWINIWGPERHSGLVKKLSAQYDFSPRLLGIMCSDHNKPASVPTDPQHNGHFWDKFSFTSQQTPVSDMFSDPEKNGNRFVPTVSQDTVDVSHYNMVNEVWHYCSVDWGKKYLCIGYNSLSDPTAALKARGMRDAHSHSEDEKGARNKPDGIRTWTWLVLCDDGTVISVYETPFPDTKESLTDKEKVLLSVIRRNMHNVFMQLSKVNDERRKQNPINTLYIRPGLSSHLSLGQSSETKIADSPSLLFYYLFDDWYATYALVAKREHQYAQQLETLREKMFAKPDVSLINRMHQYGRELAVLKRMYQSYALIIERILGRQKPVYQNAMRPNASGNTLRHLVPDSNTTFQLSGESPTSDVSVPAEMQTFGAPLSSPATVRFERLLDRINLFAISEIQECLDEKESLVFLNFNLLAMKESHAVERLTRVTILLAKVTILFMPVSIMTAYFSTQLIGLADQYTIKTYWICFAVIMIVTFILLLIYGQLSNTVEGKPIYQTLSQTAYEAVRGKWRMRGSRNKKRAA